MGVGSSASGHGPASGSAIFFLTDGVVSPNFLPNDTIETGALTEVILAFIPTAVGPYGPFQISVLDQNDLDSFSGLETINLSGTGVSLPAAKPALLAPSKAATALVKR